MAPMLQQSNEIMIDLSTLENLANESSIANIGLLKVP